MQKFTIYRGCNKQLIVTITDTTLTMTGYTFRSQIRKITDNSLIIDWNTSFNSTTKILLLTLTESQTAALALESNAVFDILMNDGVNDWIFLKRDAGLVEIVDTVTT